MGWSFACSPRHDKKACVAELTRPGRYSPGHLGQHGGRMKYIVNGKRKFATLAAALAYAGRIYQRTGNIVAVEAL